MPETPVPAVTRAHLVTDLRDRLRHDPLFLIEGFNP